MGISRFAEATNPTAAPDAAKPAFDITAAAKETEKQLGRTFGMLKQWGLQAIGKAEATEETPEYLASLKRFDATKAELRDLRDKTDEMQRSQMAYFTNQAAFAQSIAKLKADEKALTTVQTFAVMHMKLEPIRETHSAAVKGILCDPIHALLANECAQATALLEKLSASRLNYDACIHKVGFFACFPFFVLFSYHQQLLITTA